MNLKYIVLTVEDGLATVLINRPDKGNSLSPDVLTEIAEVFESLSTRTDVNVVMFTGGEKIFSGGFDLDIVKEIPESGRRDFVSLYNRTYRSVRFCSQPVIAAIGGAAVAGGFDLTQMCDVRYASEKAKFSLKEIVISLIPVLDPLWRIIGMGNALDWGFTGKMVDVQEAHRVGYVTKIFPEGTVVKEVTAIAREIAKFNRTALIETKKLSLNVVNNPTDISLKMHEWLFRSYFGTDDNRNRIENLLSSIRDKSKK